MTVDNAVEDFSHRVFNDRASSVVVRGGMREVCDDAGFAGRCMLLRRGSYPSLGAMDMNDRVSLAHDVDDRRFEQGRGQLGERGERGERGGPPQRGESTLFANADFRGASAALARDVDDFVRLRFNDQASSIIVTGEGWEAGEDAGYSGRCVALRRGRYPILATTALNNRLSSARQLLGGEPGGERGGR